MIVLAASLHTDVLVHAICCQQPLRQNRCLPWHLSGSASKSLCLVHYLLNVEFLFLFLIPVHEMFPTKSLTFVSIRQKLNASLRKSAKHNISPFFPPVFSFLIPASKKKVTCDVFGVMVIVTVSAGAFVLTGHVGRAHQWKIAQQREHNQPLDFLKTAQPKQASLLRGKKTALLIPQRSDNKSLWRSYH